MRERAAAGEGADLQPVAAQLRHVPVAVDAQSAGSVLERGLLVGDGDVRGLVLAEGLDPPVAGRDLLVGAAVVGVAVVARVVEAGDPQTADLHRLVSARARLEKRHAVGAGEVVEQLGVVGGAAVVVAGDEDVGYSERGDRPVEVAQPGLLDPTEVDEVTGVDDDVDVLLAHDRAHERVLVGGVHVGDEQHLERRGVLLGLGCVLLLHRGRQREEVAQIGRRLVGPLLDVVEEAAVGDRQLEQPARAQLDEPVGVVGAPRRQAQGRQRDRGDEARAEDGPTVRERAAAQPDDAEAQQQTEHATGREAQPDPDRGLGDDPGALLGADVEARGIEVARGDEVGDRGLDPRRDLHARGDAGELRGHAPDDRVGADVGPVPPARRQAHVGCVVVGLDGHGPQRGGDEPAGDDCGHEGQGRGDEAQAGGPGHGAHCR